MNIRLIPIQTKAYEYYEPGYYYEWLILEGLIWNFPGYCYDHYE